MSDYTPTTEEIQSRYVYAADFTVSEEMDAWGEFDRWLERHDAEVYQRGREDAANEVEVALSDLGNYAYDVSMNWLDFDGRTHLAFVSNEIDKAVAAARGESEQA